MSSVDQCMLLCILGRTERLRWDSREEIEERKTGGGETSGRENYPT